MKLSTWAAFALLVTVVGLSSTSSAVGKTYRTGMVSHPYGWCMISDEGGIGCNGDALPGITDGYFHLTRKGRPTLKENGGVITAKPIGRPGNMRRGDRWAKRGVACRLKRGLVCRAPSGHGFKIWRYGYRSW